MANAVAQSVVAACNTFEVYGMVSALLFLSSLDAVNNNSSLSNNSGTGPLSSDQNYRKARSLAVVMVIMYLVLSVLACITSLVACIGSSLAAHDSRRAHKLKAVLTKPTTEHKTAALQEHWQQLQQTQPSTTAAQLH